MYSQQGLTALCRRVECPHYVCLVGGQPRAGEPEHPGEHSILTLKGKVHLCMGLKFIYSHLRDLYKSQYPQGIGPAPAQWNIPQVIALVSPG